MNRCIGFTKNNYKCRAKTKNNNLFCCKSHEPLNKEILENNCFMCMDKIINKNEILYFKCRHIVHKPCYLEWLEYSTYSEPICIICRSNTFKIIPKNIHKEKYKNIEDTSKLDNITNILNPYIYYSSSNIKPFNEHSEQLLPNESYIGNTGGSYLGYTDNIYDHTDDSYENINNLELNIDEET
jgi:hypothetical protein